MDLMVVLNGLEKLESTLADVYGHFGNILASDKPISQLFRQLSEDEASHRQIIRYQQRLVRLNPKTFADIEVETELLQGIIDRASDFLQSNEITAESALKFAIDVEYEAAEYHLKAALSQKNPALANLLRALGKADEEHLGLLRKYVAKGKG